MDNKKIDNIVTKILFVCIFSILALRIAMPFFFTDKNKN